MNLLSMKRVQQKEAHCGPATLEMLFSFYGLKVSQDEVAAAAGVTQTIVFDRGTRIDQLAKAVETLYPSEYILLAQYNSSIRQLAQLTDEYRLPVGVEWQGLFRWDDGTYSQLGHYSVIVGVDQANGILKLLDPEEQNTLTPTGQISIKEFKRRWWEIDSIPYVDNPSAVGKLRTERLAFVLVRQANTQPFYEMGFAPASLALTWANGHSCIPASALFL